MTSSTKPEAHSILHCRQRRTKPLPQETCSENLVKFGQVVFTARCHYGEVYGVVECLSVTSWCSTETAKRRMTQTTQHNRTENLVF